jgi:hypothetical protein
MGNTTRHLLSAAAALAVAAMLAGCSDPATQKQAEITAAKQRADQSAEQRKAREKEFHDAREKGDLGLPADIYRQIATEREQLEGILNATKKSLVRVPAKSGG